MKRFAYHRPLSVAEALDAAGTTGAAYLGAGTNLLDLMKGNVVRPDALVDLTRLPGMDAIEWRDDGSVRIGALVRNSSLAFDERFARTFPAVAEALLAGASGQLRNAATAAGNVMQRTRCGYFADVASRCNKREPGSGCDALGGLNRLHAVLGWSERCIATHPSDFCVPLAALDAVVEIEGRGGRREVPLEAFHLLPGDTPERETVLAPAEMIVALRLPAQAAAFAANQRYLKVRERTSYAFAVVSAAAMLRMDGDRIVEGRLAFGGVALKPWRSPEAEAALAGQPASADTFRRAAAAALRMEGGAIAEARIALGGVALKPWRARGAEAVLRGRAAEPDAFREAAEAALAEAVAPGDNAFKIELARRIVVRALRLAAAGTPDRLPALPASALQPGVSLHV